MSATPDLSPDVSADEADIHWTDSGRPFVRTPDECFADLVDYPFEPNFAEVDGMRMHYVDEGDPDGEVIWLMHGQPDWSYLYRRMIPVLADAGFRVIANDHIGCGKSDKPVQLADYRYLHHVRWNEQFLDALDLRDITPVVQDWGSLIGLRCVGNDPDRFARVVVANGNLQVLPEGFQPFQVPDSLEPQDVDFPFVTGGGGGADGMAVFQEWIRYALVGKDFMPSVVMRSSINRDIAEAEIAGYDAPFPSRIYMGAMRTFPSLANTISDAPTNEAARAALDAFPRPVLGDFGLKDPIFGDPASIAATREQIAGAAGQPHRDYPDAGHFIQEDVGPELAAHIVEWMAATR
ncbi:MAG: haloalkane dehalogenase [Actinomycetota bacterium]